MSNAFSVRSSLARTSPRARIAAAEVLDGGVDHRLRAARLRREQRLAEVEREADRADRGVRGDERGRQRVARGGDEAARLAGGGAQHVRRVRAPSRA